MTLLQAVSSINTLLEKADRLYRQLQLDKPVLEALLVRISEHTNMDIPAPDAPSSGPSSGGAASATVHKAIQQLAQRYCGDCKNSFDELSKIIQVILNTIGCH